MSSQKIPSRLIIVAGTYDGVLAGWDTSTDSNILAQENNDDDVEKRIDLKLLRSKNDGIHLKLSFAMAAHEGSVRCVDIAGGSSPPGGNPQGDEKSKKKRQRDDNNNKNSQQQSQQINIPQPGTLLSGGYDETINVYNLHKHNQVGELKTPNDLGSPLCCAFAPPSNHHHHLTTNTIDDGNNLMNNTTTTTAATTHALVGLTSGKIILYKKRDWSVQHILSGHDTHGVNCIAVHPTGKMALSGGKADGKLILWDLMKGRLAYVIKLKKDGSSRNYPSVNHIVWSNDGSRYAYCYGDKITARDVGDAASSADESYDSSLLDVQMTSRVNQLAFIGGPEGMFVAAACDDGGLPVLEVGHLMLDDDDDDDEDDEDEDGNKKEQRRAIMAIEPVDRVVAGDDRFKCIKSVEGGSGFLVVTANSGGVISLYDLEGAARMMLTPDTSSAGGGSDDDDDDDDSDKSDEDDNEIETAVEILDSVRIGSGARVTDLAVWSYGGEADEVVEEDEQVSDSSDEEDEQPPVVAKENEPVKKMTKKDGNDFRNNKNNNKIELDAEAVDKARKLVVQAKKHQKKKKKKKKET